MSYQAETFANAWKSTLSGNGGSITSGATAFNVAAFTASAPRAVAADTPPTFFRAVIDGDTPSANTEIVWVTAMSGTAVSTCVRAAETYPGGCAAGAPVAHNDGVPIRAILTAPSFENMARSPGAFGPGAYNLLAWNMDPATFAYGGSGTLSDPIAGQPYVEAVPVSGPMSVTNVVLIRGGAGTGLANCYLGIYDSSGTRLGLTANLATAWSTATSGSPPWDEAYAISGGPITVTPHSSDDWVNIAILMGSTTGSPNFASWGDPDHGVSLSHGPHRSGYTGLTGLSALPSTITPANIDNAAIGFWVALS